MITLVFDGSFQGLLCGVFEYYERRPGVAKLVPEQLFMPDVFADAIVIVTDENKARRVWKGLSQKVSSSCLKKIYACYLSELTDMSNILFHFIRLAFDSSSSPEDAYGNEHVLRVSQIDRMVQRERHRMEAFIRFKLTSDGVYFAVIDPDFNVIPLLIRHFKNRYADQKWFIYDQRRRYGAYYDLNDVSEVTLSESPDGELTSVFHEDETLYQKLWADYFQHVNISERKNSKLHLMHVPRRYWKNLTEKFA